MPENVYMDVDAKRRYYGFAFLFALIAGTIFLYPHMYFTYKYGFEGYEKAIQFDEMRYAARVAHPYNDPYIWEKKDHITPREMTPVKIFSLFERLIGIEKTLIVWDFLGPFFYVYVFSAIILWSLPYEKTERRGKFLIIMYIGILSSCFFFQALDSFNLLSSKLLGFLYHTNPPDLPMRWFKYHVNGGISRIFHPALNLPLFLFSIGCLVKSLQRRKPRMLLFVMAGILTGGLIYIRIFDYVISGCILAALFLIHLLSLPAVMGFVKRVGTIKAGSIFVLFATYLLFGPVYIGIFYRITPIYLKILGFLIAACIVLLLLALYQHNNYPQKIGNIRYLMVTFAAYLLTSLPGLFSSIKFRLNNPDYGELFLASAYSTGWLERHSPDAYSIRWGLFLLLLLFFSERLIAHTGNIQLFRQIVQIPLLVSTGVIIAWNIQVLTGENLVLNHYTPYLSIMLTFLAVFSLLYVLYVKLERPTFIVAALVVCLASGFLLQVAYTRHSNAGYIPMNYEKDNVQETVYRWIRENTEPDSVIASAYYPPTMVMHTKRFSFIPDLRFSPSMKLDEFCERYLLLQGLSGYELDEFFTDNDPPAKRYYLQDLIESSHKGYLAGILAYKPSQTVTTALQQFKFFRAHSQKWFLERILGMYKLDYLIMTPPDIERIPEKLDFFDKSPHFRKVFDYEDARVYKVEKNIF